VYNDHPSGPSRTHIRTLRLGASISPVPDLIGVLGLQAVLGPFTSYRRHAVRSSLGFPYDF
jgi:hypothetical protein